MGTSLARPMWRMSLSHPAYDVNTLGQVRRAAGGRGARRGKPVKPQEHRTGYYYVHLWEHGRRTAVRVHRLVAEAFYGPIADGLDVNHKDGDRGNNAPLNLEPVTPSENVRHAYDVLHRPPSSRGARHYKAKLTPREVRWMRRVWPAWRRQGRTQAELGEVVGVSDSVVSRILSRQAWAHVQEGHDASQR